MKTIYVSVCGDYWTNPTEVKEQLDAVAGKDQITIDLQFEGPCLWSLGISDTINKYCKKYQIPPSDILITRWDNIVEKVEYTIVNPPKISSFIDASRRYWLEHLEKNISKYVFGFFVGRRSIPRAVMMYELYQTWGSQNLLSCLSNKDDMPWLFDDQVLNLYNLDQWLTTNQQDFISWWATNPIPSIDQHDFEDQYSQHHNTNKDLMQHYYKFDIEIVSESYTCGDCFFPTEKTIRPIAAAKPMIVHGPKNFIENLVLLGFKNYSSVWNESYDQFEGVERWQAMKKIIADIMSLHTDTRLQLLKQAQEIANFNRQHLTTLFTYDNTYI
jgi:hypothetical protein